MKLSSKKNMMIFCLFLFPALSFAQTNVLDTNSTRNNTGTNLQEGMTDPSLKKENEAKRVNTKDLRSRSLDVKTNCAKNDHRCLQESELNPPENRIK